MAYTVAPFPYHQFLTDAGVVAAGYKLYTYESGTTTALASYSDSGGTSNANPIVLDSEGRAKIFLSGNAYKFVLKTAADVTVWTIDDVYATPEFDVDLDISATAGEALAAGDLCFLSDGSGAKTAGRWYKTDSDTNYMSITANSLGMAPEAITSGASGSIRLAGRIAGLSGMAAGSVYYASATAGALTATAPVVNARAVGVAESATVFILTPWVAPSTQELKNWSQRLSYTDTTAVGNVGAGEDDLISYSVPASTLAVDEQKLAIVCWGTTASNADTKTLKGYFGSQLLFTAALTVSQVGQWQVGVVILRTAAATQIALAQVIEGVASTDLTLSINEITAPTETLSGAVVFKLTGEATTTDDISQSGMTLKVV